MITLGTNISVLRAQRQLSLITNQIGRIYERLSTGQRINRASDDPAGLAIADSLRAQQKIASVAIRNANDGISSVAIADSALDSISLILTRMNELAQQAANGVYSVTQRSALAVEFNALALEIDRITNTTEFNNINLLQGGGFSLQIGTTGGALSRLDVSGIDSSLAGLGLGDADGTLIYSIAGGTALESQSAARLALDAVNSAVGSISIMRGTLGAIESRLNVALNHLHAYREQVTIAESRIRDADIAQEAAELVRLQILQQLTASVLAQASRQAQIVLKLLE